MILKILNENIKNLENKIISQENLNRQVENFCNKFQEKNTFFENSICEIANREKKKKN